MAKHMLNFAFHILNISNLCYWSVIPLLVSYWLAWHAPMHIHDGGRRICCLLSSSRRQLGGLLCVFMVWGAKVLSTIHIMKVPCYLLSASMNKIVLFCRYLEFGMLNLEFAWQLTNHIHDRSGKFE
jgi:hypothetical protein